MILNIIWDFVFFFIIPSCIATAIYSLLNREKICFHSFLTFASYFVYLIATLKSLLGEKELTILESFKENGMRTYLHYAFPLFLLAVGFPAGLHFVRSISKELFRKSYMVFVSIYCIGLFQLMMVGRISNLSILAGGTCGLALTFLYKGDASLCTEKSHLAGKLKASAPIGGLWAVIAFIYIPNKIYLTNMSDFNISYFYFFVVLAFACVVFLLFSCVLTSILVPGYIFKIFTYIIFAFTAMGYIQENFLNGSMFKMDDRKQMWGNNTVIGNAILWIVVIIAIVLICIILEKKHEKAICIIALYLTMIQLFTIAYVRFTTPISDNTDILKMDGMFELSSNENTIVFVLDWYDEQILEEIVENDSSFLDPLDGFVWYKNQTSRYAYTSLSVPYLLTGVKWDREANDGEYVKSAFEQSSFFEDIAKQDYRIDIYTDPQYLSNTKKLINNYSVSRGKCKIAKTIEVMLKCSRYQMAPFLFKDRFFYSSSKISELTLNGYIVGNRNYYDKLLADGVTVNNNEKGIFKFYHLMGVHSLEIDQDIEVRESDIYSCGRGAMKIVYEFLEQLKEQGLYDNSEIIITADHGQNYLNEPQQREKRGLKKNTSSPILLIKKRNSSGPLSVSYAPVSHDEFCATVIDSVGANTDRYERNYDGIAEDEERIREFEYYREGDVPYQMYHINGMATDIDSWQKVTIE